MNTYEGMFIFVDSLKDDALEAAVKELREEIEKLGGVIENTARMGRRPFARLQAKKHKAGNYIVMNFQVAPDQITPLLARIKRTDHVFRTQILNQPAVAAVAEPVGAGA